mgnify:CR=1 FL=1
MSADESLQFFGGRSQNYHLVDSFVFDGTRVLRQESVQPSVVKRCELQGRLNLADLEEHMCGHQKSKRAL